MNQIARGHGLLSLPSAGMLDEFAVLFGQARTLDRPGIQALRPSPLSSTHPAFTWPGSTLQMPGVVPPMTPPAGGAIPPAPPLIVSPRRPIPEGASPLLRSLITEEHRIQDILDNIDRGIRDYETNGIIFRRPDGTVVSDPVERRRDHRLIQRIQSAQTAADISPEDRALLITQLRTHQEQYLSSQRSLPLSTISDTIHVRSRGQALADHRQLLRQISSGELTEDRLRTLETATRTELTGLDENADYTAAQGRLVALNSAANPITISLEQAVNFDYRPLNSLPAITFRGDMLRHRQTQMAEYQRIARLPEAERRAACEALLATAAREQTDLNQMERARLSMPRPQLQQHYAHSRRQIDEQIHLLETGPRVCHATEPLDMRFILSTLNHSAVGQLYRARSDFSAFLRNQQHRITSAQGTEIRLPSDRLPAAEHWPGNTQVVGSSLQDIYSFGAIQGRVDVPTPFRTSLFTAWGASRTLDQAIQRIQTTQIAPEQSTLESQQTMASSLQTVRGWDREQVPPPARRILVITGDDHNGVIRDPQEFIREMKRLYPHLRDEDFMVRRSPTLEQVRQDVAALRDFSANNPGAEVLMFINAHGTATPHPGLSADNNQRQGAHQGRVLLRRGEYNPITGETIHEPVYLTEDFLKTQTRQLNQASSVHILFESCFSGAWITQAPPPPEPDLSNRDVIRAT